ncbi:MAG: arsenate reductase ArsC [Geobacteraceae bacterium]|nr:arsenate reductase ArsC [Geobacteraceae bacterium]
MDNKKTRVLFICNHNSARSQMAEAFLNSMAGDRFEAESAGFEVRELNPLAVAVMEEVGIDISGNKTKEIFDLYRCGRSFSYEIKVCDRVHQERCPLFPGMVKRLSWSFADPSALSGSDEEKLAATRGIRDEIRAAVAEFIVSGSE